jgi:hypothetical protein
MGLRVIIRNRPVPDPTLPFSTGLVGGRTRSLPLVCSLAAHAITITLLAALPRMAAGGLDWSNYHVEVLRFRAPHPIFYFPGSAGSGTGETHSTRAPRSASSDVELPPTPENDTTVLQPKYQQKTPPLRDVVPQLAAWARQMNDLRNRVIAPGRVELPDAQPRLAAPPVLAVPNREPALADINIALPKPVVPAPALAVLNSATAPLRDAATAPQAAALEGQEGQAANLIAVSRIRTAPDEVVTLSRGLSSAPRSAGDNSSTGFANVGGAAGAAADKGQGNASTSSLGKQGSAFLIDGANSERAPAGFEPNAATGPSADADAVVRIQHPLNGHNEIVVMQSTSRDDLPESEKILTGNPVYTVYVPVGDRKEWLLRYCLPARQTAPNSPFHIFVEAVAALLPPYPISTTIPAALTFQEHSNDIMFHGFLNDSGGFRDMETTDRGKPFIRQIAALLGQWRFRPAFKDKLPAEIEVLLVIPGRR